MISNHLCKKLLLPNLNWQIYKLTISECKSAQHQILIQNYENPNLNKQFNDWWWIIQFLKWIRKYSFKMVLMFLSFIPLLGPFIVDIFGINDRTRKYLQPFFKEQNWSKNQIKQFELMNKCDFIIFGIIISILDSIPLFSVITMISNVVAGALWASNILESDNIANKTKSKKEN
ncbi:Rrt8p PWA37_000076 [Arxiozyma heterogenica]|uniref:Rrt8p n=1 Tax=Arxiozyma heterogenica TaxID=278026 RepID=UPI002F19AC1B